MHLQTDNKSSSSNYCDHCAIPFDNENDLSEHVSQKHSQIRTKETNQLEVNIPTNDNPIVFKQDDPVRPNSSTTMKPKRGNKQVCIYFSKKFFFLYLCRFV